MHKKKIFNDLKLKVKTLKLKKKNCVKMLLHRQTFTNIVFLNLSALVE